MNTRVALAVGSAPFGTQEVPVCPVCGQPGRILHRSIMDRAHGVAGRWDTMRCSRCRSGWLNPVPVPDALAACYVAEYYTHADSPAPSMGSSKLLAFMRAAVLSAQKDYRHLQPTTPLTVLCGALLKLVPLVRRRASFNLGEMVMPFRKGGRLLEIGCGSGSYLALMQMLGWSVAGIEPDPVAAAVAAKAVGCEVHVGTVENAPFGPASFDVVVSNHVIEHVYDPKSFVSFAARLLSSGGLIVVQTPNFQSLGHNLFGVDWFSLDPPRHLCLFVPSSLRGLFESSGLFSSVRTVTTTVGSRLAIRRRYAVCGTGAFLGKMKPSYKSHSAELLFRAVEALGNSVFAWGEEIRCIAKKA